MKPLLRSILVQLAWLTSLGALLYGLAALGQRADAGRSGEAKLRAALFVNGTLGDKSFFDAAAKGMRLARETLPVLVKVIEGGTDPTRWQAALAELADSGDYELIVVGTFTMVPYVQQLAEQYPHARFVVYDASVDYAKCRCQNVHSILFRQNEGAYLAGYLAARLDRAGALPGVPPGSSLGVVGGMQFPVIDDFIIGFRAGAQAAVPGATVLTQYANSFSDPAAGKEVAKAQFGRGVGLIFHAAGATGQGVNEAALEGNRYTVGVDMDQYAMYRASNPRLASRIVTSVVKNVDVAVVRAIGQALQGQLAYGGAQSLGLAEQGVSLAPHSDVLAHAPAEVLRSLEQVQAAIARGERQVPSAFDALPAVR